MKEDLKQVWDLDSVFSGGSGSTELKAYFQETEQSLTELTENVNRFTDQPAKITNTEFAELVEHIRIARVHIGEIGAFISCLLAQDVTDKEAKLLAGRRSSLAAQFGKLITNFDLALAEIPEQRWGELLEDPSIKPITFILNEHRDQAKDKLPAEQEALLKDLSVDGYHAWGEMYNNIVGKISIPWDDHSLSVEQVTNKLSDSNREVREKAFEKLEQAWFKETDLFTDTLNHLAGFRVQTYAHRGWGDVLKEPLSYNRMSKQTLTTMWDTITANKPAFYDYLQRKADLFGIEKLDWFDLEAPISTETKTVDYQTAAKTIVAQFSKFSERMAKFSKRAFEESWIEAEDRSGKRPGGFCTSFPKSKQTRIFMTYAGSASNVATLAHELGHGYHQHVMDELDVLNQDYAMNVAETASTLAEMIVADAAVKEASSKEEKIALLEDKIQRSIAFFMNIHARFLFETRFYEARKEGYVSTDQLNQLMEEAQKEAYGDQLASYHPTFWASKLHFHITGVPFYNFPYTFGYLFSLGIYAYAQENQADFSSFYDELLKDTGRMTAEQLAEKHLQVNLEEPTFWQNAIDLCVKDVETFLMLTK
ncbi:pepF/M3 family oligoendopeptidase [Natronobacillus azotifigens]|uniref:M3 family oligoendopeptidase n=1 Tax=Natronobacillus azotifigens TaxID=472978 RepID=A0A9J6RF21_9BACI|nr:M3 family oligoendopeptidase [Natronobacillus azotifigens]MCZ0703939.1 M3 family oligoendopeptidase [Natronobacillus azotifigens]